MNPREAIDVRTGHGVHFFVPRSDSTGPISTGERTGRLQLNGDILTNGTSSCWKPANVTISSGIDRSQFKTYQCYDSHRAEKRTDWRASGPWEPIHHPNSAIVTIISDSSISTVNFRCSPFLSYRRLKAGRRLRRESPAPTPRNVDNHCELWLCLFYLGP